MKNKKLIIESQATNLHQQKKNFEIELTIKSLNNETI